MREEADKKFIMSGDFHTHTVYSRMGFYLHGKGRIKDNVAAAAAAGLREVAVTDHGPSDFYGIDMRKLPQIRREIEEAARSFPDIRIYLGVEADIVDSPNGIDVKEEDIPLFDFINAGYHYVPHCDMLLNWLSFHVPLPAKLTDRLRKRNTERIVRALKSNRIKVLTHPGDKAYIDILHVAKACEETGTLVEINARHRHPDAEDLRIFAGFDVRFIIGSDAHRPEKVGAYKRSLALAAEAGIGPDRIVNIEEA